MMKDDDFLRVDEEQIIPGPLEQIDYKIIQEGHNMTSQKMLDEINQMLSLQPIRELSIYNQNILQDHNFQIKNEIRDQEYTSIQDLFKIIPKDHFKVQDLTKSIEDFINYDQNSQNLYFQKKIQNIRYSYVSNLGYKDGTRKFKTKSEFIHIKSTNERFLVIYQFEERIIKGGKAFVFQCYIFKYNIESSKFEVLHSFLDDINFNDQEPQIFNRVFINQKGIFYLQKYVSIDNQHKIQINYIHLKDKKTGLTELKSQILHAKQEDIKNLEKKNINFDNQKSLDELDIGFVQNLKEEQFQELEDKYVIIYQFKKANQKELLIYSMRDTSKPIIKYSNVPLITIDYAFVIKKDHDQYAFILQSSQSKAHIQLNWKSSEYTLDVNQNLNEEEELVDRLKEIGSKHQNEYTQRLFLEDMIIIMDFESNLDAIYYMQEKQLNHSVTQLCAQLRQNQYFLHSQIQQFHSFNSFKVYKNNYSALFPKYMTNQKVNEMYMSTKQGVSISNNMIIIGDKQFNFDQKKLPIYDDLNIHQNIQFLKLYSPKVKDTMLIKYHFSNNHAIFFFVYRYFQDNAELKGQNAELKGVYFYLLISKKQLFECIEEGNYLVNEGTNVFIMKSDEEIELVQFNEEQMYSYCGGEKQINGCRNEFIFELTRDFADPTKDYFPFLFCKKVDTNKFEIYFSFMNVEAGGEYISQNIEYGQDKQEFSRFIQFFKIEFYQRLNEPILLRNCNEQNSGMRMDVQAQSFRSQNMFCRSSNWENKVKKKYQAVFQVGFNFRQDDFQAIEIRDYLVTINLKNQNFENNQVSSKSNINIKPIKMQMVTLNEMYLRNILTSDKKYDQAIENHRLISNIDDSGNINGSFLVFNHKQSNQGIWKITNNKQIIKQYHNDIADSLVDSYIFVTDKIGDNFNGQSFDGPKYLNKNIIEKELNQTAHIYDILDLSKNINELNWANSIQTGMSKMTIQKTKFVSISTVILSNEIIQNKYLSSNQLLYWLYYFQKYLLCTKLFSLTDLSFNIDKTDYSQYFQPQIILRGQNVFSMKKKDLQIQDIQKLISFENKSKQFYKNSLIDNGSKKIERFFRSFELNSYFDYYSDPFTKTSIIQCLLEAKKSKELNYLVNYSIKNYPNQSFLNILIQDMPMILESQNLNLNEFLNISQIENSFSNQKFSLNEKAENQNFICNLEQILSHDSLKKIGPEEQIVHQPKQFEEMTRIEEIINIINKSRDDTEVTQVQFSIINFEETLRKILIDLICQRQSDFCNYLKEFSLKNDIIFSHLFLAKIINQCKEVQNFFEQSTIQKIVNIQFKQSQRYIKIQLLTYLFGFFIPYVLNCLSAIEAPNLFMTKIYHWVFYFICQVTQALFLILELPEIYYKGLYRYLYDFYNIFDVLVPIFFNLHLQIRFYFGKPNHFGWIKLMDNLVEIFIIIGSIVKLLQFVKYKQDFAYFVQMFFKVMKQLGAFILMFTSFICIFSLIQYILSGEAEDADKVYPGMHPFLRMFIQTIRISVGDLKNIQYKNWADNPDSEDQEFSSFPQWLVVHIIWAFWLINIYLVQITMLNLLIAQVGQIYDLIMSTSKSSLHKDRALLNLKVFEQLYFFDFKNEFTALIIQDPLQNEDNAEFGDFETFSQRVIKSNQETASKMETRINSNIHSIEMNLQNKIDNIEIMMKQILNQQK